ncbi:MAG: oxidoreductase [Deltaproteobacteria bacterium]|nr:oxidoreductase [Deltaproteobacteria bacterium]
MLTGDQIQALLAKVTRLLENDTEFAAAMPDIDVAHDLVKGGTVSSVIERLCDGYADRPALGRRATEIVTQDGRKILSLLPRFETITYREMLQRAKTLAAALHDDPVGAGDRVGSIGFPSADYAILEVAIPFLEAVSVPMSAGAPASNLEPIVEETEPTLIACSIENLSTAAHLAARSDSVGKLLVFDYVDEVDAHRESLTAARGHIQSAGRALELETLEGALDRGRELPAPPPIEASPDRLAAIVYTSGTSGSAKGAMQTENLLGRTWAGMAKNQIERGAALPTIAINYLPMSHTGGRGMMISGLGGGGTAYFVGRSDLSTILEDLSLVRPTQLNFVPRVWEMLHREFVNRIGAGLGDPDAEDRVLEEIRTEVLGGRYVTTLSGSAPIAPELATWVERLTGAHLLDGFGSTETAEVLVDGQIQSPPITDHKLDDVPELGYHATDHPHPRGELLIKSEKLFAGYYKRPDVTAEVFDDEGFFRTGDIVAQVGPGQFKYVDRRNAVLKLSNGEFVAITKLETLFSNAELVDQIFVHGNSEESYLLAVVVPTEAARKRYSGSDLERALLASLGESARQNELQSYEVPRDLIVESSAFSIDNGLLTGWGKPARRKLREHYGESLARLYADRHASMERQWRELGKRVGSRSTVEIVCAAAQAALGAQDVPPSEGHFTDLGGDSLSAVSYASALSDLFKVEVEVGMVISPVNDLKAVADQIDLLLDPDASAATFSSVHGAGATTLSASDLTLSEFIDSETLEAAKSLVAPSGEPRHVLVTGANGYLGRYLTLDWLERMARVGGTVTCMVRARDDDAAGVRLSAVFDSGDDSNFARFRELAEKHLQVIAGEKSEFRMGLSEARWEELIPSVDLVVDPAALVNHVLPYPQLFGPNVAGMAELIRFAISGKLKTVAHVSSVAVGMTTPAGEFTETADVREMVPSWMVSDGYAAGYATSKWAGEVLLREAHDLCGLPVSVYRCDMIMAEPSYRGQLNLPDVVTRLMLSVAATGLAPFSFYCAHDEGNRPDAHFDGLPVDFVRDAINSLAIAPDTAGFRTYHVVNPNEDGISLDVYVDWLIEAGCRIQRIDDFEDWFSRFDTALRNLPDDLRQASILPLAASFSTPQSVLVGSFAPTDEFEAAIKEAGIGDAGGIPSITPAVIEKYVTDLEHLGYLDPADRNDRAAEAS